MKVILLKDCKDGKENQIIEVSNGYGANFLIKKGYGLPYNKKTSYVLKQKLINLENTRKINHQKLNNLKDVIEKIELLFSLKKTGEVIHGSITKKQIHQKLKENHVNLESHQIENIKINTLGVSSINIFLNKEITAKLKIKVLEDVR